MYSKAHILGVGKHLEPLVFKSSLSSRSVLPALARPYQQQQQQQQSTTFSSSTSLPVVQLWPTTTTSAASSAPAPAPAHYQHQKKYPRRTLTVPSAYNGYIYTSEDPLIESSLLLDPNFPFLAIPPSFHWTPPYQPHTYPSATPLLPTELPSKAAKKPDYVFAHGASGFAKRRRHNKRRPYHTPEQHFYSEQMGEDAFFRRYDSFGISDGVGGWSGLQGR